MSADVGIPPGARTPEKGDFGYSPVAWELAHYGKLYATKHGPRREIVMATNSELVAGAGNTSSEATRDLARNLDEWGERQLAEGRFRDPG